MYDRAPDYVGQSVAMCCKLIARRKEGKPTSRQFSAWTWGVMPLQRVTLSGASAESIAATALPRPRRTPLPNSLGKKSSATRELESDFDTNSVSDAISVVSDPASDLVVRTKGSSAAAVDELVSLVTKAGEPIRASRLHHSMRASCWGQPLAIGDRLTQQICSAGGLKGFCDQSVGALVLDFPDEGPGVLRLPYGGESVHIHPNEIPQSKEPNQDWQMERNDSEDFRLIRVLPTRQELLNGSAKHVALSDTTTCHMQPWLDGQFRQHRHDFLESVSMSADTRIESVRVNHIEMGVATFKLNHVGGHLMVTGSTEPCVAVSFIMLQVSTMPVPEQEQFWRKNMHVLPLVCFAVEEKGQWVSERLGVIKRREPKELANKVAIIGIDIVSVGDWVDPLREVGEASRSVSTIFRTNQATPTQLCLCYAEVVLPSWLMYSPLISSGLQTLKATSVQEELFFGPRHAQRPSYAHDELPTETISPALSARLADLSSQQRQVLEDVLSQNTALVHTDNCVDGAIWPARVIYEGTEERVLCICESENKAGDILALLRERVDGVVHLDQLSQGAVGRHRFHKCAGEPLQASAQPNWRHLGS